MCTENDLAKFDDTASDRKCLRNISHPCVSSSICMTILLYKARNWRTYPWPLLKL